MRKFIITVNGKSYEVEVEELSAQTGSAAVQPAPVISTAPVAQPAAQPAAQVAAAPKQEKAVEQKPSAQSIPSGADLVRAPMPGTILDIKVNVGDEVKRGQVLLILEAMKMENEIMAPRDGKVVAIQVDKGASVNANDVLVALQ